MTQPPDTTEAVIANSCMCSCHGTDWMCEECCDGPPVVEAPKVKIKRLDDNNDLAKGYNLCLQDMVLYGLPIELED